MRHNVLLFILVALTVSAIPCRADRAEREAEQIRIAAAVEAGNFNVEITMDVPKTGEVVTYYTDGTYMLRFRGDKASGILPNLTANPFATFGGGVVSPSLDVIEYEVKLVAVKKKSHKYALTSHGVNSYNVTVQVSNSGSARVSVTQLAGSRKNFLGQVMLPLE